MRKTLSIVKDLLPTELRLDIEIFHYDDRASLLTIGSNNNKTVAFVGSLRSTVEPPLVSSRGPRVVGEKQRCDRIAILFISQEDQDDNPNVVSMEDLKITLEPVLERELYTTPPLMSVVVAKLVGSKQNIPRAFRVTKDLSTVELRHLRRIKDLSDGGIECVISKCRTTNDLEQQKELEEFSKKFAAEEIFQGYRVTQVPSKAPVTELQLKNCTEIWPCKFAKSTHLAQCLEGSVFSEAEKKVIEIIVTKVVDHIVNGSDETKTAGVVFRCAKIYGVGLSNSNLISENPVKHSTMLAIDSVATNAGAGHWKCTTTSNQLQASIQKQLDEEEELKEHRTDAKFLPYLCTNYDIFLTEQPCFMCTMGLVQSRIRRLFYLDAGTTDRLKNCQSMCYPDRAIEHFYVHREKNLNHRFEAWKIRLEAAS